VRYARPSVRVTPPVCTSQLASYFELQKILGTHESCSEAHIWSGSALCCTRSTPTLQIARLMDLEVLIRSIDVIGALESSQVEGDQDLGLRVVVIRFKLAARKRRQKKNRGRSTSRSACDLAAFLSSSTNSPKSIPNPR